MHRPPEAKFDNPQEYPEDEEEGMAPGDPEQEGEPLRGDTGIPHGERRRRRMQDIDDHLRTRDYQERIKEERRARLGFK